MRETEGVMEFQKFLRECEILAKGRSTIELPDEVTLPDVANLLEDQQDDVDVAVRHMDDDVKATFFEALDHAVKGFMSAAEAFKPLAEAAESLSEADDLEVPKIGRALLQVRDGYADMGRVFKALLQSREAGSAE